MSKTDYTEFYKLASTLFLGIGIAAVLQTELLKWEAKEPSRRGKRRWGKVDQLIGTCMFVLLATGELLCIRVLTAQSSDQDAFGKHAYTWTKGLLVVTVLYVLAKFVLSRALSVAWHREDDEPARCDYVSFVVQVSWAAVGLGVGLLFLAGIAATAPNTLDVFLPHHLYLVWVVGAAFTTAGLVAALAVPRRTWGGFAQRRDKNQVVIAQALFAQLKN